jgi:pimeloyl-ACP methyl ester carboxylesterase
MTEPTTYVLIPGAGGDAGYWDWVTPHLRAARTEVIAVGLPYDNDAAGLNTFCDVVCEATAAVGGPVVVVAQSMGAFTAPMVAERRRTDLLVLVNPMVPGPGETARDWWGNTGQSQARLAHLARIGVPARDFDPIEDFFHDVPDDVKRVVFSKPEPRQSDAAFDDPWPLRAWPPVPTRVLQGTDDRMFPPDFQRRVAQERLGLQIDTMAGGHLMAFSRPGELADRLEAYRRDAGL